MVMDNLQVDLLKVAALTDVVVHQSIGSTNQWCLQQCKSGRSLPFACFAEEQTSGRGRRGKQWHMSAQSNIAMSIVWSFVMSEKSLHLLPLTIAIVIAETLEDMGLKQIQIKWPNDVYVRGKKISGVLIETQTVKTQHNKKTVDKNIAVVIGVGLNYDMSMHDNALLKDELLLTDICSEIAKQKVATIPQRNTVANSLLQKVVVACQSFNETSKLNLEKFRTKYDYCRNKSIEILMDDQTMISGIAQGVNDDAELLVLVDGAVSVFNSAEISIKATDAGVQ